MNAELRSYSSDGMLFFLNVSVKKVRTFLLNAVTTPLTTTVRLVSTNTTTRPPPTPREYSVTKNGSLNPHEDVCLLVVILGLSTRIRSVLGSEKSLPSRLYPGVLQYLVTKLPRHGEHSVVHCPPIILETLDLESWSTGVGPCGKDHTVRRTLDPSHGLPYNTGPRRTLW